MRRYLQRAFAGVDSDELVLFAGVSFWCFAIWGVRLGWVGVLVLCVLLRNGRSPRWSPPKQITIRGRLWLSERSLPRGWLVWGAATALGASLATGVWEPLIGAALDALFDARGPLGLLSIALGGALFATVSAGLVALWSYFSAAPPRERDERVRLGVPLPSGLVIQGVGGLERSVVGGLERSVVGGPERSVVGGLRLGDPILDGALWVECDDAGAARDLLTDERLRGDLLALFCEHPGAVLADGQIAIRYVVGLELPGYIHAARGLPFYVPAQIAAARRAALALAEALEARSASEVAAEATARSARKTPVRTAR